MPKLYVANATRQVKNFVYTLPGHRGQKSQIIPIGKQIKIGGDLSMQEIDHIVEYHTKYGLVEASAVDRTKPFIGMVYSIDKPVPPPRIESAMVHNIDVLTERGQDNRQKAALTANQALENSLDDTPGLGNLGELEMTITEEGKGSGGDGNRVEEGFRVTRRTAEELSGGGKGKGKGRGKRQR